MPTYSIEFDRPLTNARLPIGAGSLPTEVDASLQNEIRAVANSVRNVQRQLEMQNQNLQRLIHGLRVDLVDLATAIAVEVIGETEMTAERVAKAVSTAQAEVIEAPVEIFLHPEDCELLQQSEQLNDQTWQATPDTSISRGGCRIEGAHFRYVSDWKGHVAGIRRALLETLDD